MTIIMTGRRVLLLLLLRLRRRRATAEAQVPTSAGEAESWTHHVSVDATST